MVIFNSYVTNYQLVSHFFHGRIPVKSGHPKFRCCQSSHGRSMHQPTSTEKGTTKRAICLRHIAFSWFFLREKNPGRCLTKKNKNKRIELAQFSPGSEWLEVRSELRVNHFQLLQLHSFGGVAAYIIMYIYVYSSTQKWKEHEINHQGFTAVGQKWMEYHFCWQSVGKIRKISSTFGRKIPESSL